MAPTGDLPLRPEDFDDIKRWQPLPPVVPEVDNNAWEQERIPVCCYDGRKWARETLASVAVPAMLIIGDADIVRPEHVAEMFRLLGGGVIGDLVGLPRSRLAVLPGTTHMTLVDRAAWLTTMITEFLDAPMSAVPSYG